MPTGPEALPRLSLYQVRSRTIGDLEFKDRLESPDDNRSTVIDWLVACAEELEQYIVKTLLVLSDLRHTVLPLPYPAFTWPAVARSQGHPTRIPPLLTQPIRAPVRSIILPPSSEGLSLFLYRSLAARHYPVRHPVAPLPSSAGTVAD